MEVPFKPGLTVYYTKEQILGRPDTRSHMNMHVYMTKIHVKIKYHRDRIKHTTHQNVNIKKKLALCYFKGYISWSINFKLLNFV